MEHVDLIQTIVLLALVVSNRVLKLRIKKLEEFRITDPGRPRRVLRGRPCGWPTAKCALQT